MDTIDGECPFNYGKGPIPEIKTAGLFPDGSVGGLISDYIGYGDSAQTGIGYVYGIEVNLRPGSPVPTGIALDYEKVMKPILTSLGISAAPAEFHFVEQARF